MKWFLSISMAIACLVANDIPEWVQRGILAVETNSYYDESAKLVYVNKQRGQNGELGPYQMTKIAWRQIRLPGESFYNLQTDMEYAEECFRRYIAWLYMRSHSWSRAVQEYNAGPRHSSPAYLKKVRKAAAEKKGSI